MLISVIIPIYNTRATLQRCVESVLRQSIDNMEILLIDDASPDGAGILADQLEHSHSIIRTLHISHAGLSAARNAGVKAAKGQYVTFVDSDDEILPNTWRVFCHELQDGQIDIMEYGLRKDNAKPLLLSDKTYSNSTDYWLDTKGFQHCYACNKFFRHELLLQYPFIEGLHFEDVELWSRLLATSLKIKTVEVVGYLYHDNPDGITHQANHEDLFNLFQWNCRSYEIVPTPAHFEQLLNIGLDVYRSSGIYIKLPEQRYCRTLKQCLVKLLGFNTFANIHKAIIK